MSLCHACCKSYIQQVQSYGSQRCSLAGAVGSVLMWGNVHTCWGSHVSSCSTHTCIYMYLCFWVYGSHSLLGPIRTRYLSLNGGPSYSVSPKSAGENSCGTRVLWAFLPDVITYECNGRSHIHAVVSLAPAKYSIVIRQLKAGVS